MREADSLRLVSRKQRLIRIAPQHRRQLPGEIDGVTDTGIHSLTADRAVNVCGIAEQEHATPTEVAATR